jgi:hypothetical protein
MRITAPAAPVRSPERFRADRKSDPDHRATRGKPKKSSTRASERETFCVVPHRARLRPLPGCTTQNDSDEEKEAHD